MSMVRLNAEIRFKTIENLLNKKYAKDDLELEALYDKQQEADKAVRKLAYEAAFSAATRKILNDAADGFFPKEEQVTIRIEKGDGNYFDSRYSIEDDEGNGRPVPFRNSRYMNNFAAVVDGKHPFAKAVDAHRDASTEYGTKANEVRNKKHADRRRIEVVLESVTTVKRLTEVWPEVQEFLPEMVSGEGGGVPTQIITDLNKEFGL